MEIRPERVDDQDDVREVNRLAFEREDEGRLVDALRAGGYSRVSLVAENGDGIVGHVLFSALSIATRRDDVEALALAPMAVVPHLQRRGIGSMLVQEGLRACGDLGYRIVIVLGHPGYYRRFGFSTKLTQGLKSPYSGDAFMALELAPGTLEGVTGEVEYPPPFEAL